MGRRQGLNPLPVLAHVGPKTGTVPARALLTGVVPGEGRNGQEYLGVISPVDVVMSGFPGPASNGRGGH